MLVLCLRPRVAFLVGFFCVLPRELLQSVLRFDESVAGLQVIYNDAVVILMCGTAFA